MRSSASLFPRCASACVCASMHFVSHTTHCSMRQSLGHFGMNDCVPAHVQVRVDVLLPDVVAGRAADLRDDVQP